MNNELVQQAQYLCRELQGVAQSLAGQTEALREADHITLIKHLHQVGQAYDTLNAVKKLINDTYDRLSREYVPDAMRKAGVKTVTVDGVGRVVVSHRYSCTMIDKGRGYEWLRSNGHEDLITETVNSSTLSAFAKNLMVEEGMELPDDIFKVGTSPFTSITAVK